MSWKRGTGRAQSAKRKGEGERREVLGARREGKGVRSIASHRALYLTFVILVCFVVTKLL